MLQLAIAVLVPGGRLVFLFPLFTDDPKVDGNGDAHSVHRGRGCGGAAADDNRRCAGGSGGGGRGACDGANGGSGCSRQCGLVAGEAKRSQPTPPTPPPKPPEPSAKGALPRQSARDQRLREVLQLDDWAPALRLRCLFSQHFKHMERCCVCLQRTDAQHSGEWSEGRQRNAQRRNRAV